MNVGTEDRLRAALRARAGQVTAESLALPAELPPRDGPRRWPLLAAAAAVVVIAVATTLVVADVDRGRESASPPIPVETLHPYPPECPKKVRLCLRQALRVGEDVLELLSPGHSDFDVHIAREWVLRVRGGEVLARSGSSNNRYDGNLKGLDEPAPDAVRPDSFHCRVIDSRPYCLFTMQQMGEGPSLWVYAFTKSSSEWHFDVADGPFSSGAVDIRGLDGEVYFILLDQDPTLPWEAADRYWARVWRWGGDEIGCTPPWSEQTLRSLPGWPKRPQVPIDLDTVDPANCRRR